MRKFNEKKKKYIKVYLNHLEDTGLADFSAYLEIL